MIIECPSCYLLALGHLLLIGLIIDVLDGCVLKIFGAMLPMGSCYFSWTADLSSTKSGGNSGYKYVFNNGKILRHVNEVL